MKYARIATMIVLVILKVNANGQLSTSPYTIFGIGQISSKGSVTNPAMSGAGIALETDHTMNTLNPASFGSLDSLTFMFEVGVATEYAKYKSGKNLNSSMDGNLSFLGLAFRVTRWWGISAGVLPFSTVGYLINATNNVEGEASVYPVVYRGTGGISKFYLSNGVSPLKNLRLGITTSYYLGSINRSETVESTETVYGYSIEYTDKVNTLYTDFGIQYCLRAGKIHYLLGATYGDAKTLSTNRDANLYHLDDTISLDISDGAFNIPRSLGIGLGILKENKLKLALDYERQYWSGLYFSSNPLQEIRDSERFAIGIEYLPANRRQDAGWKKLYYRVGVNYLASYLVIEDEPINSKSLSFGIGIPVKKDLSKINLSFELGQTGTLKDGLLKANYGRVSLNFSLRDQWFRKYKYE
jgi:hypothetical protein